MTQKRILEPGRRCINYKAKEKEVFWKIEKQMCNDMGLTISELHKTAIRHLWNTQQELYIPKATHGFINYNG